MSVEVLHKGTVFTVPPEVVTLDAGGGALVVEAMPEDEAAFAGGASTNADGGKPPIVSASAAFSA
jgi:hypothetical protein